MLFPHVYGSCPFKTSMWYNTGWFIMKYMVSTSCKTVPDERQGWEYQSERHILRLQIYIQGVIDDRLQTLKCDRLHCKKLFKIKPRSQSSYSLRNTGWMPAENGFTSITLKGWRYIIHTFNRIAFLCVKCVTCTIIWIAENLN